MSRINKNLNIHWLGIFLLFIAIVAPWFNLYISNHDIVKSYSSFFGVSLLMFLTLYFKCQIPGIFLQVNYIKLSLSILFLFGAMSTFWAVNLDFAIGKFLLWVIVGFSFILALNLSLTSQSMTKFAWYLTISAGIIGFIGLLQYFINPFSLTQAISPASTFGNKNMATQVLVLLFPMSIFLLLSERTKGLLTWVLSLLTAIVIAYIVLTGTRAAWLSIIVQILFITLYLFLRRRKTSQSINWNQNKLVASIFSLAIILVVINLDPNGEFKNSFIEITERVVATGSSSDNSSTQRFQIWNTALKMIYDAPFFGTGLGSYSQNLGNEGYATWTINNTFRVHNDLIELVVELGLIGFMLFLSVVISITLCCIKILQESNAQIHLFFLMIFSCLIGSFINLQFSFPYQMAVPLLLFGLYSGFIAQYTDQIISPIKNIQLSISTNVKKLLLVISATIFLIISYLTYFQWIVAYDKFDRITRTANFELLDILNTPVYEQKNQFMLYSLGGNYFNKGNYIKSILIDSKFLEFWPNHLDVLYRAAYANHKIGKNSDAIKMAKKLKLIEPDGLYNSYIVEMFVFANTNNITKLEETFEQLLSESDEFLKLNDDTYRLMIYFTLASKKLGKYAPELYEKYIKEHGYSCEVENNIAIHYFNKEDFNMASIHVNKTIDKDQNCLNLELVRLLAEKGLLIE
jgi:O-antigen ligase